MLLINVNALLRTSEFGGNWLKKQKKRPKAKATRKAAHLCRTEFLAGRCRSGLHAPAGPPQTQGRPGCEVRCAATASA